MSELQLDPDLVATLSALETHRVEFVLVGDVANAIYDHGGVVSAVAIVPGSYGRNVERLSTALQALNAEPGIAGRPDPRGLEWRRMDLRELAPCSFMTMYVDVDIDFSPAHTDGYRDLFEDAARVELAPGARPHVASPEDLDRIGHGTPRAPAPSAPSPPADFAPESPPAALPPAALPPEIMDEEEIRASIRDAMARTRY
jgi:hypothetical protein